MRDKRTKEAIGFLQKERAHKGLINGSNGSGEPVINPAKPVMKEQQRASIIVENEIFMRHIGQQG